VKGFFGEFNAKPQGAAQRPVDNGKQPRQPAAGQEKPWLIT
jgi:hypothetical protein